MQRNVFMRKSRIQLKIACDFHWNSDENQKDITWTIMDWILCSNGNFFFVFNDFIFNQTWLGKKLFIKSNTGISRIFGSKSTIETSVVRRSNQPLFWDIMGKGARFRNLGLLLSQKRLSVFKRHNWDETPLQLHTVSSQDFCSFHFLSFFLSKTV